MVRMLIQRRIRRLLRLCVAAGALLATVSAAEWEIDFPALKDGRPCHSAAAPVEDGSMLVC